MLESWEAITKLVLLPLLTALEPSPCSSLYFYNPPPFRSSRAIRTTRGTKEDDRQDDARTPYEERELTASSTALYFYLWLLVFAGLRYQLEAASSSSGSKEHTGEQKEYGHHIHPSIPP